jgi:hypothetical protein
MSYKKSDYFDFCEWALVDNPDLSDIDLSRSFTQRDSLYMKYSESKDIVKFFEDHIVKNCILKTWKDKFWGAWQVLKGNASIIIYRIKKEDFYK